MASHQSSNNIQDLSHDVQHQLRLLSALYVFTALSLQSDSGENELRVNIIRVADGGVLIIADVNNKETTTEASCITSLYSN